MTVVIMGFIFVAIISIIMLFIYLFWIILDIIMDADRDQYLQLKFSQFKKFYSINPEKYDL